MKNKIKSLEDGEKVIIELRKEKKITETQKEEGD